MSMPSASRRGRRPRPRVPPAPHRGASWPRRPTPAPSCSTCPTSCAAAFAYEAGQFCTFRVWVDGAAAPALLLDVVARRPSTPSWPVTVKRVPGGLVSNWMLDNLGAGDEVETTRPAGVFCLAPRRRATIVAFAGGSGITPVFSLLKTALATTGRRVRLLYANRDPDAVIFGRGARRPRRPPPRPARRRAPPTTSSTASSTPTRCRRSCRPAAARRRGLRVRPGAVHGRRRGRAARRRRRPRAHPHRAVHARPSRPAWRPRRAAPSRRRPRRRRRGDRR